MNVQKELKGLLHLARQRKGFIISKGWLAGQMGYTRGTFWGKVNGKKGYTPLTEEQMVKIRNLLINDNGK